MSEILKSKKGFILHKDSLSILNKMSDEQAGILFKAIYQYQTTGKTPDLEFGLEMAITPFLTQFKRDDEKSKRGEHHWNWKNGITNKNSAIRNSTEMKHWRIEVFSRDKYTCQKCFKKGGTLHAHHVKKFADFPDLRFAVSNGLTLCINCHRNIHSKNSKKNDKFTN